MRKAILSITLAVLVLGNGAFGDTIELPLNCTGMYDINTPLWTMDFDLGVTFSEISNVYIDWSGTITAEVAYWSQNPDDTFLLDGIFWVGLYESNPNYAFCTAKVQEGIDTYPAPEPFDLETVIASASDDLTALLDGKGSVAIGFFGAPRYGFTVTLVNPSGQLNSATLIVEGTVVPEPSTILLLAFGLIGIRVNKWKGYAKF
jgi:hypothetical protein